MSNYDQRLLNSIPGDRSAVQPRSNRPDVRNPLLRLPAIADLQRLPAPAREALRAVLLDIAKDATARAETCWRKHKAPMAAYWKAVAVYARHTARAMKGS